MSIEVKQRLLPDGKPNKPSRPMKPMYITVHNTDNTDPGATAEAHARYILNGSGGVQKSWHYTVDDCSVYQHLRDDEQGWHAGDGAGPGNALSIGVEVCMYAGMDEPKAWSNAAQLLAMLSLKHGIPLERIVPHRHWSGKACPSRLLPQWQQFMALVEQCLREHEATARPNEPRNVPVRQVHIELQGNAASTSSIAMTGYLIEGKVYAPVRELASGCGRKVKWDAQQLKTYVI
ncbi:N-acetylmuramoyl-L-alanine amidase [Paenibacillus sp. MER TA 81-3]|uniref:N-acetylmuramoyl-L-alanine amidase n=1 Tax=Paenibacillus sp. MER TA 81-3 TaxID=2939573 RepID=UPI00203E1043|nr:N-acetylmuramoyl-L-alanine amidase [Paenibacillus sp. MER TA 81-3]MCM3338236.1 N-acetylmuramoyl-L-alanine amidase [Paenibacillus sp. MER TA 81-3]